MLLELSGVLALFCEPLCELPEDCEFPPVLLVEDVEVLVEFPALLDGSPEQPVQLLRKTFSSTISRTIAITTPPIIIFTQPLFLP